MFTDFRKMIKGDLVDAVSVCTPNNCHAPLSIASLQAGKHVLCEKPLAMNGAQARKMAEAAKRAGRILMTAQCMRYSGNAQALKRMIEAGRFGKLYFGKAMLLRRTGIPRGWFHDKEQAGGGPMLDIGVHVLDLTWYLMGKPQPVSVFGVTFDMLGKSGQGFGTYGVNYNPKKFSVEDLAAGLIKFKNGAAISLEASWAAHTGETFLARVLGTKGGAQIFPDFTLYEMDGDTKLDITPAAPQLDGYLGECRHFIACIQTGKEPISPGYQSVVVVDMLEAIYKSAESGKLVTIRE